MRITKKVVSLLLAVCLLLGNLPAVSFAAEKTAENTDVVYLSISFDGKYINDCNETPIVYMPIPLSDIEAVDLVEYGLENMLYDADGDGAYETTALQLLIYAHENIYGGDWSEVTFDALPGSSYFAGGIFGFTENLVYFLNGEFPVDESQESDFMTVGATSDRIVLEAGDFLDVASFNCYSFLWDQLGGFHLFADQNDSYVHDYAVNAGETLTVKLKHSFCDLMFGQSWVKDAEYYEVYYGSTFGVAEGSVTTDESGNADITFDAAGTYYVWCDGDIGTDDGTHGSCDQYFATMEPCIVSTPAYAKVTVAGTEPPTPREPQSVTDVLNATMAQLAATVTEPSFGTSAGEWTVFSLARGNYFAKGSDYFEAYYARIEETVKEIASSKNMNGALDKNKSTENSRLIMALSAIGKNATSVGNWDLVEAYSANGINWIKKQGINGTIWTLIALDSGNYETSDATIRQQCVDALVSAQHNDGGWSLVTAKTQPSNVDITGMTLTALYPYRDQPAVKEACEVAIQWLSDNQLDNGGFPYGTGETSESCAWAIVALTTWGINPDTDARFIKNGKSAIDNLLTYYLEDEARFEHGRGAGANAMATDQACYALVAYDRFINNKNALYDYSDVIIDEPNPKPEKMEATLVLPEKINPGVPFNGSITINMWDNEASFKLIDMVMDIPQGVTVSGVTVGSKLSGGALNWHVDADGKLRLVYFDANANSDLIISGEAAGAELFNIQMKAEDDVAIGELLYISVDEMSVKLTADSQQEDSAVEVDTETAQDVVVEVVEGLSFSVNVLYTGDGVDLISTAKKAVAVAVTGIDKMFQLLFTADESAIEFVYSEEITNKTGIITYVALVDASIDTELFTAVENYELIDAASAAISFGDSNSDGVINAQDALAAVDAWLRKGEALTDLQILTMNVNGDSRINTFDALGIVEAFVDGTEFGVVTKAAIVKQ